MKRHSCLTVFLSLLLAGAGTAADRIQTRSDGAKSGRIRHVGVQYALSRWVAEVNLGVNEERRRLDLPLPFDHMAIWIDDEQVTCLQL